MKLQIVLVVSLALVANSKAGLIDGLLGTVKDTASSITHGIGGAYSYGKNFVFGGTETNAEGRVVTKPGIVGTISHKIHDVSQAVREEVRSVLYMFDGDREHGQKGIVGRFYDRMKCRVFKIRGFLFGDSGNQINNNPYSPFKKLDKDTSVLCDQLRKHFLKNNTLNSSGIRQTLINLHDGIYRIRNNITKNRQDSNKDNKNKNKEQDGSDLIDIRTAVDSLGGIQTDFENGVDAAYDKVHDDINEGRDKAKSSLADAKRNTNDFIENQRRNIQNNYNKLDNDAKKFKSDVDNSIDGLGKRMSDESDTVKKLLENGYSKVEVN